MNHASLFLRKILPAVTLAALSAELCGCLGDGPAVEARPQTVGFQAAPSLKIGNGVSLSATASSGLPVSYLSLTPAVCSVDNSTGTVTAVATGTCTIAANQSGNSQYAPAPQTTLDLPVQTGRVQSVGFATAPSLSPGGIASVSASATSGLAISYSSTTPSVCRVDGKSGLVTDLTAGVCIVAADQAGNADFDPAQRVTQSLTVSLPSKVTVPGAPTGVTATAGAVSNSVSIGIGAIDSGGSPLTGYAVSSVPSGIAVLATTIPIAVTCPSSCAGYGFSVSALNAVGAGPASVPADVVTDYQVTATFSEPDTQPNNTIFVGSFTFDATSGTVTNFRGRVSEAMTGGQTAYPNDTMTWLTLGHQLSSMPVTLDGVNGLLVTTFLLDTSDTLSANPSFGGTDGWSPGSGTGIYYGYPGANPGNAYVRIFVNTTDPAAPLTQAQTARLAYADCSAGGMMGATCMTGTSPAGYGTAGTMGGDPASLVVTKK